MLVAPEKIGCGEVLLEEYFRGNYHQRMVSAYVALGGNIGDTEEVFKQALDCLGHLEGVSDLECSSIYQTTAVSDMPQRDFLNAVCRFTTTLDVFVLWDHLQQIEIKLGKKAKPKNAPRVIDLDFLFYGSMTLCTESLTLPHPRWQERLFVLIPLRELL